VNSGATTVGGGATGAAAGAAATGSRVASPSSSSRVLCGAGLNECGVCGNISSRKSFIGGGAFVLSAGRTGLTRSSGLRDTSDLSIIVTGSTPALPLSFDDSEDAVLGDLVEEMRFSICSVVLADGVDDDSGALGRRSKEVGTKAEAGGASLTLRPRKWP